MTAAERDCARDNALSSGNATCWFGTYEDGRQPFELLLPTSFIAAVEAEVLQRAQQSTERKRAAIVADARREVVEHKASSSRRKDLDQRVIVVDKASFVADFDGALSDVDPGRMHRVLAAAQVWDAASRAEATRDEDHRQHATRLVNRINQSGGLRTGVNPGRNPDRWGRDLAFLVEAHPHMQGGDAIRCEPRRAVHSRPVDGERSSGGHLARDGTSLVYGVARHRLRAHRLWRDGKPGLRDRRDRQGAAARPIQPAGRVPFAAGAPDRVRVAGRGSGRHVRHEPGHLHRQLERCSRVARIVAIASSRSCPRVASRRYKRPISLPPRPRESFGVSRFAPPQPALSRKLTHLSAREIFQFVQEHCACRSERAPVPERRGLAGGDRRRRTRGRIHAVLTMRDTAGVHILFRGSHT